MTDAYKLWHGFLAQLPRHTRYTLGAKIDGLFTDAVELILSAGFSPREGKLALVHNAIVKIDGLKFFVRLAWEMKALDHKKYAVISAPLAEIGKMLGGWHKHLSA